MTQFVTYQCEDGVAHIRIDDGKVNVMSVPMMAAMDAALDRAQADAAIVVLQGRPGIFSAGFDTNVFKRPRENRRVMVKTGAELALRILRFPRPVVVACTGHAYPMGAFLLMAADARIGAQGAFRLGMNEVAISLTVPAFAIALARSRLTPAHLRRTAGCAEMFNPDEAVNAGILDRVVPPDQCETTAVAVAQQMLALDADSYRKTKAKLSADLVAQIETAIGLELSA